MSSLLKSSSYFPLLVTIDDREPSIIEEEFRKLGNMIIQRQRLEAGDYLFDEDLLVERKTIPDFCASIKDGRLFNQVKKIAFGKIPACYILEGKKKQFKETDFTSQAIQGILLSISVAFKIPILNTKNSEETVAVMLQCYKQINKSSMQYPKFYPKNSPFKKRQHPLLSQKIHILEGFPGIGTDRAERLLMKFGNLQAVFTAEDEELLKVPGLGKKTVERLIEVLKK